MCTIFFCRFNTILNSCSKCALLYEKGLYFLTNLSCSLRPRIFCCKSIARVYRRHHCHEDFLLILGTDHLTCRGGYGFLFRSEFFFRTTRELEYIFFVAQSAKFYSRKTLNQIIFFSSTKIRIFFSATLGIRIFF